jgi:endonuclease/exonuclease/phosphatase family metal-dependent hydrolase
MPIAIFYSHAQDISTGDGEDTLFAQLDVMRGFIQTHSAPENPRIIMGDLNVPGENARLHGELLARLTGSRDCSTLAGNVAASGFTSVVDNNFYEDSDDRPSSDQRLDYVLLIPGIRSRPVLSDVEVLRVVRNGRFTSDHFGLSAVFKNHVMFEQ